MKIDISKLLSGTILSIKLADYIDIPSKNLKDSLIENLKEIYLSGKLTINEDDELVLNGVLTGIMVLKDDITLDPVQHKFKANIEEILDKSENILDITDVLWHNILVEIPSKVRSTDEDIELSGNGWRLISESHYEEERNKQNNPFANLQEMINEKEEK